MDCRGEGRGGTWKLFSFKFLNYVHSLLNPIDYSFWKISKHKHSCMVVCSILISFFVSIKSLVTSERVANTMERNYVDLKILNMATLQCEIEIIVTGRISSSSAICDSVAIISSTSPLFVLVSKRDVTLMSSAVLKC